MSDSSHEYLEWKKQAFENGLISDAAFSYYVSDSKHLYTVFVDGTPVTAPVFSFRSWLTDADIEAPIGEFNPENEYSEYDNETLEKLVEQIAFTNDDSVADATVDDYLWNAPVYAVTNVDRDEMKFDLTVSDYYTMRSSAFELEDEMAQNLYELGVSPDTEFIKLKSALSQFTPESRSSRADRFEKILDFSGPPGMAGAAALTVFNTRDGYVFPIVKRSNNVSEARGWLSPVPSGVFQPYTTDREPSLKRHLLKEFSEYFFAEDPEQSLDDDLEPIHDLNALLDSDGASLRHTSSGIDCKNIHVQFNGVLVIDDESYYHEYIEGKSFESWEYDTIEFVSITDADRIKSILHKSNMNPYDIVCISEGLQWLESNRPVELPVDLRPSSSHRHSKRTE